MPVNNKNTEKLILEFNATKMNLQEKEKTNVVASIQDVTKKVQIEESLSNSEKRFKALVQHGADLTAIVKSDGTYLYVSPNYPIILGLSEEELIGKNAFDFFHPEDLGKLKAEFSKLATEKRIKSSVYRFKNKFTGWSWVRSTGTNLVDDDAVRGFVINSIEVTDLIEAQQALNKSNERFEMLMHAGSESVWDYDLNKKELFLGNGFYHNFGIQSLSLKKNNALINSLIHPKDKTRVIRNFRKTLKDSSKFEWNYNYRLLKPTGYYAIIEDKAVILRDDNGMAYRVIGAIKDVTTEHFYKELERIEKEVMEFSMLNHTQLKHVLEFYILKIEELFPEMQASILRVKKNKIYNIASTSLPKDYINAIDGNEIGNNAGSCGTAAFLKEKVIVSDIENDIRWANYKDIASKFGYKACWSQPIFNKNNEVVATLANYYKTSKSPTQFEELAIERSQRLISIIIEKFEYLKNIQKSNERYELINKASRDAIYEWDIVNDIYYWSDSFETIFGHDFKNKIFSLQNWIELMHPDDDDKFKTNWDEFLNDSNLNLWIKEFRFKKADGTYVYVEETGHIIRDRLGNPVRMVGVLRDISQLKLLGIQKELLTEISKFFKEEIPLKEILHQVLKHLTTFDSFSIAEIWLTNSNREELNLVSKHVKDETVAVFYNPIHQKLILKNDEGLPGKTFQSKKVQVWDEIQSSKIFVRNEGAKRANLHSAIGLPIYHNDVVIGVLVLLSEMSAFKIENSICKFKVLQNYLGVEIKRKQKEEEMFLLFESAPEIMAIASPHGYFIKANPALCKLLGRSEDEIIYQPFDTFIHPDDVKKTINEYEETITGERLANNFVNRYKTKSGNYRWISWSSSEIFDEEGNVFAYGRDVTELIELQLLLENASKLAKLGGWEINVINNKHYWSPMTRVIHEVESDFEPNLENALSFYRDDFKVTIHKKVQKALKVGKSFDFEAIIVTAKGTQKWIRAIGNAEIVDGKCIRLFGSFQDINERKKIELENKRIYEERNNILESIGDAFFAVDTNWIVTYWNKEAEIVLNKKREDIVGKNLWEVYSEAKDSKFYKEYLRAIETQQIVTFDEYYSTANLWLEVTVFPTNEGLSVYFKDVSIKKFAEQKIQETNERFEKVVEATNDAIWDYDIEDNALLWSKGFSTQFQYDLTSFEPSFEFFISRIHPEDRAIIFQKLQQFISDNSETNWFEEFRFLKADGSYAYVMDRAIFIRDKKGKAIRAIGAITDITYQKEHENSLTVLNKKLKKQADDLVFSNKELEQFAYVASHDLQEPLRMVTNFLSQLEKKYKDQLDERAEMYIHYAVDGAKRMRQIILDILEFSRIGKTDENKDLINLNEIVNEIVLFQNEVIKEKNAIINIDELPIIFNHRTPLKQIFQNLISNALKYSKKEEAPQIEISVKELKNEWQFSVKDNGIGISEEYYDKIFEIFQRLHVRENYSGTGIGLSIVKKILDNLGGKIWVESKEGLGSTFSFLIPKQDSND